MKPRTVCFCQPILVMISGRVAPFLRCSNATTWAVLLPSRGGAAVSCALTAFFPLGAALAGVAFLAFAALALFWLLDPPFLGLAGLFEVAFSGATAAPS